VVAGSPQLGVTVHAIRHLLARAVFLRPKTRDLLWRWLNWRMRHNEEARRAHYRSPMIRNCNTSTSAKRF
jgi:hypothetical protein